MIIAKEKKQQNIAEYILYIWQVEGMIRAYEFDIMKIEKAIISKYDQPENVLREIRSWYNDLIKMMKEEKILATGHLQFIRNTVNDLYEFHLRLFKSEDAGYKELFYDALPHIIALQKKMGSPVQHEIETCLNGLALLLLLNLSKQPVSPETANAMKTFSKLLAYLSAQYRKYELGELELNTNPGN